MLGKPKSEWDAMMYEYARQIISATLDSYKPYAIRGLAAMNFCLGDESVPRVIEIASRSSNKRLHLGEVCTLKIEKDSDFFPPPRARSRFA